MSIRFGILQQTVAGRSTITVDSSKVEENLTDFPLLIKQNNFASEDFSETQSDLRFYDSDSNLLPHEIVNFSSGNTEIWVKTDLSSSSDTVISYDFNGGTSGSTTDVWSNDFCFVCHCKDNGDDTLYDSVNDVYSNAPTDITFYTSSTDAKFQSAAKVNGVTGADFTYTSVYNEPYTTQKLYIQWFGYQIDSVRDYIISRGGNYYSLIFGYENDKWEYYNSPRTVINDTYTDNSFGYVGFSYDFNVGQKTGTRYFNGSYNTVSTTGNLASGTQGVRILAYSGTQAYLGYTDEIRYAKNTRSVGWMDTEYNMMMNHSTFFK